MVCGRVAEYHSNLTTRRIPQFGMPDLGKKPMAGRREPVGIAWSCLDEGSTGNAFHLDEICFLFDADGVHGTG